MNMKLMEGGIAPAHRELNCVVEFGDALVTARQQAPPGHRANANTVHLHGDMVGQTISFCRLPGSSGDRPRKAMVYPTK
jgi:hypothetical protein